MQALRLGGGTFGQVSRPGGDGDRGIRLGDAEALMKCLDIAQGEVCGVEVR